MKTSILPHCGNAPKMERVIDLAVACIKRDFEAAIPHVHEDFIWKIIGDDEVIRYRELSEYLSKQPKAKVLTITNALSHGNGAMCEGEVMFDSGDTFFFCIVVAFTNTAKNAVVKSAHTYFIKNTL